METHLTLRIFYDKIIEILREKTTAEKPLTLKVNRLKNNRMGNTAEECEVFNSENTQPAKSNIKALKGADQEPVTF